MVRIISIFLGTIFCLVGCWTGGINQPNNENQPEDDLVGVTSDQKPVSKFWLKGVSFSISKEGQIYFVDESNLSVVLKADLKHWRSVEKFIDLREWLKWDFDKELQIDDLCVDDQGRLILAESTTGKILRISRDATKLENLADSYDGYRLSRIDGLTGSPSGDIYFGSPLTATLYKIDPSAGKLSIVNENLIRSNDLIIDHCYSRLLVSESEPNRVVVFELHNSDLMIKGWNLITFPTKKLPPLSIDFTDRNSRYLAVLINNGKTMIIFDLEKGTSVKRIKLPYSSEKVRCHNGWFYLQSSEGIFRKKIPVELHPH